MNKLRLTLVSKAHVLVVLKIGISRASTYEMSGWHCIYPSVNLWTKNPLIVISILITQFAINPLHLPRIPGMLLSDEAHVLFTGFNEE